MSAGDPRGRRPDDPGRRRSTLGPRGYTGPLRLKPPEPEPEPEPEEPDPLTLLLGPGALALFALAAVVAVFPFGFLTDDPQWWAVIPPSISTALVLIGLVWTLRLRQKGALPIDRNHFFAALGVLLVLLVLAGYTAMRMWVQRQ